MSSIMITGLDQRTVDLLLWHARVRGVSTEEAARELLTEAVRWGTSTPIDDLFGDWSDQQVEAFAATTF